MEKNDTAEGVDFMLMLITIADMYKAKMGFVPRLNVKMETQEFMKRWENS